MAFSSVSKTRAAAAGIVALVLVAGVLLGRAWERSALAAPGADQPADTGTTASSIMQEVDRSVPPSDVETWCAERIWEDDDRKPPEPRENLNRTMIGSVDDLSEQQVQEILDTINSHYLRRYTERTRLWNEGGYAVHDTIRYQRCLLGAKADSIEEAYEAVLNPLEDSLGLNDPGLREKFRALLTPEQVEEYNWMVERWDNRRSGRRSNRGGGGDRR